MTEGNANGPQRRKKNYRWDYRTECPERAFELEKTLRIGPVVARVLANRGYGSGAAELETFLKPTLASINDPFGLCDMERGVARVMQAMERKEKIAIYGDYDCDGATSTSLLVRTFEFLEYPVCYYVPHRISEGYGLNSAAIDGLIEKGVKLLITVDNGISAVEQVKHANARELDVIITDHHQAGAELPPAVAVINPNRADCPYPGKYLTGVGVAFKLAHALLKRIGVPSDRAIPFLRSLLDLVAIGTLADLAPLIAENRVLVKHGLEQIAKSTNEGVRAMKRTLQMESCAINGYKVCFQIAPRLNAAGRTDHAQICVELLTTHDEKRALEIAQQLDVYNQDRRNTERDIVNQGLRFVEQHVDLENERVLVVHGENWHLGVIGIVASKIMELYDRPVIVLSELEHYAKGSARSLAGFNMYEALQRCREHLISFGGHPFAAGLQLSRENIPLFREAINACAREMLQGADISPALTIDTEVRSHEIGRALIQEMGMLEPHGPQNPCPVFSMKGLKVGQNPRIVGTNHLKLHLGQNGKAFSAIGFNMGNFAKDLHQAHGALVDIAFVPTLNTFGLLPATVELELKDVRIQAPS